MIDPDPTRTDWVGEPAMPRPARLNVGLPRFTSFDVQLRRVKDVLTIIIQVFVVVTFVVALFIAVQVVRSADALDGRVTVETPATPAPTPT